MLVKTGFWLRGVVALVVVGSGLCFGGVASSDGRSEHVDVDELSQQLFETYIARRGKINSSTYRAAAQIVAERSRNSGFWRSILTELQKGKEENEMGCVHVLGKMLAVDARARDVIRREKETGQIRQWKATVCLGPEVVQELIKRGQKAERSRVDQYAIALARARVPPATEFFRMVLRDEIGRGNDSAKFHAAVGLAQLGEADGFAWLVAHTDRSNGFVANAYPSRMSGAKHLGGCCVAALQQLSGENLKTKGDWESWWERVDRKTLPKNPVDLVEQDAFQDSRVQSRHSPRQLLAGGCEENLLPVGGPPVPDGSPLRMIRQLRQF